KAVCDMELLAGNVSAAAGTAPLSPWSFLINCTRETTLTTKAVIFTTRVSNFEEKALGNFS
ncbi:MAG: hypothetical protein PUD81_04305, partial [Eggerthellales bacterium]|nr:hypothetical protein [Eggerthellales bacterium]